MPRDNDISPNAVYADNDLYGWPRGPELCQGPGDNRAEDPTTPCGCPVFSLRSGAVAIHVIGCTDAERVASGDWYQPLSGSLVATGQLDRPDPALDLAAFASLISRARSGYEK